jgi:carbon-monoxide dehydrogenase medium subunit
VLDAEAIIQGPGGQRTLPLESFFQGPGKNALNGELLTAFRIPKRPLQAGFQKLGRAADDIAVVNAAVSFELAGGRMKNVRIVAGAVAPVPLRCRQAEAVLEGHEPDEAVLRRAAGAAAAEVAPISDQRASAEYRQRTAGVLVRRALEDACASI